MPKVRSIRGLDEDSFISGLDQILELKPNQYTSKVSGDIHHLLELRHRLLISISEMSDQLLHIVDLSIEFENSSKVQSLRPFNIYRIFKAKLPTPVLLVVKRSLEFLQRDLERCVHDGDELLRKMAENSTF